DLACRRHDGDETGDRVDDQSKGLLTGPERVVVLHTTHSRAFDFRLTTVARFREQLSRRLAQIATVGPRGHHFTAAPHLPFTWRPSSAIDVEDPPFDALQNGNAGAERTSRLRAPG